VEVHSYASDPDDTALAAAIEPMPANLHVHPCDATATGSTIINLNDIIKCEKV
jgi:hypothetical protein